MSEHAAMVHEAHFGAEIPDTKEWRATVAHIKHLIDSKADLEVVDPELHNETPLHFAVSYHLPETTRSLLAAGANPNAVVDSYGEPAPLLADIARWPYNFPDSLALRTMRVLLEGGADPNVVFGSDSFTPMMNAMCFGHPAAGRLLVEFGAPKPTTVEPGWEFYFGKIHSEFIQGLGEACAI